jgi:hypothetical protein
MMAQAPGHGVDRDPVPRTGPRCGLQGRVPRADQPVKQATNTVPRGVRALPFGIRFQQPRDCVPLLELNQEARAQCDDAKAASGLSEM